MSGSTTAPTTSPRITKRKLDDAISTLDDAVRERHRGAVQDPSASELGPSPTKRRTTAKSIYASLSKYGFRKQPASNNTPKTASSRTPTLTSLLNRSRSMSLSRTQSRASSSSTSALPNISHPQALISKPPYRPASTSDFLLRLGTFKLATYRDKPHATDAVAAAKCGWKNEGKDRLVCDNCSSAWVVGSTAGMSRDAANTLTERQRVSLVTSHKETCPWRKRQCDASIYRIPLKGSAIQAREIRRRARQLTPLIVNVIVKHPLMPNQMVSLLTATSAASQSSPAPPSPSSISSASTSLLEPSESALVMSLFGWEPTLSHPIVPLTGSTNRRSALSQSLSRATSVSIAKNGTASLALSSNNGIRHSLDPGGSPIPPGSAQGTFADEKDVTITCQLCQRRLGLWAFSTSVSATNGTTVAPPGGPPRVRSQARTLDVLKEHRSFCPYVVRSTPSPSFPSTSQAAPPSRPGTPSGDQLVEGWKAMLGVVGRAGLGMRRRKSDVFGKVGPTTAMSTTITNEVDEAADVDSMVESVKRGGSRELMKYVKGLLG